MHSIDHESFLCPFNCWTAVRFINSSSEIPQFPKTLGQQQIAMAMKRTGREENARLKLEHQFVVHVSEKKEIGKRENGIALKETGF